MSHGDWDYIDVAGGYPQGPASTPALEGVFDSPGDAFFVLIYLYLVGWALAMLTYASTKTRTEKAVAAGAGNSTFFDGDLKIAAYKTTQLGSWCYTLYQTFTFVIMSLYLMLIFDTYWECELKGPDNLCFRGSKPLLGSGIYPTDNSLKYPPNVNQNVFFGLWCFIMAWALYNFFFGSLMPNFFRARCSFDEATHILCQRRTNIQVMSNPNMWVIMARKLSASLGQTEHFYAATADVVAMRYGFGPSDFTRSFTFMCAQYTYNSKAKLFSPAEVSIDLSYDGLRGMEGLTSEEHNSRLVNIGQNLIPFSCDTWLKLLGNELNSYLYMYQLTFFLVWLWFGGIIWCSPQVIVVLVCAVTSIRITHANQVKIAAIGEAGMGSTVFIKRKGEWLEIKSEELVPGDVIRLTESNWVLPCDAVIVQGTCICDESGLTGESMPVRKSEVPSTPGTYNVNKDGKHTLFAGTTMLQADTDGSIAVVTETGIRTAKGDLVSMILYPTQMVFEYNEELKIVFSLLSGYAAALFFLCIWLQWKISPMNWVSIFAFACFTISQILPPLLPVSLVIGHTKSANRLQTKGVMCVDPRRIAISGKIHAFMFDKTGTLTKQGLDFIGVHRAVDGNYAPYKRMEDLAYDATVAEKGDMITWSVATCHAVTYLRTGVGTQKLVGNQVEVQMFTGSQWTLDDQASDVVVKSKTTGEELTIVKRFEFDHHTMSMSVLVRDETGNVTVFCKGAPERVGALCKAETLPADFDSVVSGHATQGCYVLGMTTRSMGQVSDADIANLVRNDVEVSGEMSFISLLLFRNELKPDTTQAIIKIKEGDVRPVMVTGDNAHCGLYIARECNIVEQDTTIYLSDKDIKGDEVTWSNINQPLMDKGLTTDEVLKKTEAPGYELAITGKAMAALTKSGRMDECLLKTRIFARVQPDQKVQVVQNYINRGFITGMCGDGGNDCGALRMAHCGIALSDAEASVVSPFTSNTKSIQSVVDVLCEGRCGLVTSFAAYRFYITYGLNWSVVKTINFAYGVRMPIVGYLTIDSICSWLCAWAITGALPLDSLSKFRPTSSLFAGNILWSVLVPWFVNMMLMTLVLFLFQTYPEHTTMKTELTKGIGYWELGDTWESTIFTYFQVCPLIWCGMCYSLGTKFRKPVWTNFTMIAVWGSIFFIYFLVLVMEPNDMTAFFHVASNAHNGLNTESPVWMRWQMPLGCPDATSTLAYNTSVGLGSWREALPSAKTCTIIAGSVAKCGPACETHGPQPPSPGMPWYARGNLLLCILAGMAFMMLWEAFLNWLYIHPAQWEKDEETNPQKIFLSDYAKTLDDGPASRGRTTIKPGTVSPQPALGTL